MNYMKTSWGYVLRLKTGEEIIEIISELVKQENIKYGVVQGIGACTHVNIAYYSMKHQRYMTRSFQGDYEIMSLNGNISWIDNNPKIHLHLMISDDEFRCVGGHLNSALVTATCEVNIFTSERKVNRVVDSETGLFLLDLS